MCEEAGIDRQQLVAEAYARYLEIYRTSENGFVRLRTLDSIVRLFGLEGSQKVEVSGKVNVGIELNSKNRQKLLEDDVFRKMNSRALVLLAGYGNDEPNGKPTGEEAA